MFDSEDEELMSIAPSSSVGPVGGGRGPRSSFAPTPAASGWGRDTPREIPVITPQSLWNGEQHSLQTGWDTPGQRHHSGFSSGRYEDDEYRRDSRAGNYSVAPSSSSRGFQSPTFSVVSAWPDDEDIDPFLEYRDARQYTGITITSELTRKEDPRFSFYIFCQETCQIHGVPRPLTTPPIGVTLNKISRWRRKFELEFGKIVHFIFDESGMDVEVFKKGPSDSIAIEVVNSHFCVSFNISCLEGLKFAYWNSEV